jgi:hypothetical protein
VQASTPEQRSKNYVSLNADQKARLKALDNDPRLRDAHERLVGLGTLTDDEFWEQHKVFA